MSHTRVETAAFLRGWEMLEAGIVQAANFALRDAIKATEESGKATSLFKDRSGKTRASIKGTYSGFGRGSVSFGGASRLLDKGTRPHTIKGRPFLRFEVNGTAFYRRFVKHPGTAERPFVRQARERGEMAANYGAAYYVGEAIRRAR